MGLSDCNVIFPSPTVDYREFSKIHHKVNLLFLKKIILFSSFLAGNCYIVSLELAVCSLNVEFPDFSFSFA